MIVVVVLVVGVLFAACRSRSDDKRVADDPSTKGNPTDEAFWKWFTTNSPSLSKEPKPIDVMNRIQEQLNKGHPGVLAEIGSTKERRKLVLTADGDRKIFPIIQRLYASRPTVEGWDVVAFRPRDINALTIEMNGQKLDPRAVRYRAQRSGDQLDVEVFVPGYVEGDKTMAQMAFIALDHTLGEYDVETKVAGIKLLPIERADATARPLAQLPAEIDALPAHFPN
jgi:hypothetical protein